MIKLVLNELFKIIKKKSTFIFLGVVLLIIGLITLTISIDNVFYDSYSDTEYYESNLNEINTLLSEMEKDSLEYNLKLADKEMFELALNTPDITKEYINDLIFTHYHNAAYDYYNALYYEQDEEIDKFLDLKNEIQTAVEENDYKYYLNIVIDDKSKDVEAAKMILSDSIDETEKKELEISIKSNEKLIEIYEYRMNNSIAYDYGYYDEKLLELEWNVNNYYDLELNDNRNKAEEDEFQQLSKIFLLNEKILEDKNTSMKYDSLNYLIQDFFTNYGILLLIFVIFISGGILSQEFSKGTIKTLLIMPYSRSKILLSKYITTVKIIFITVIIMVLFQILIGGLLLGFDSLSSSVLVYNSESYSVMEYNIFTYLLINLVAFLPYVLIFSALAFMLSVLIPSSAFAITIPIVASIGADIINMIAIDFNVEILKYFISLNWDFRYFLFNGEHPFNGITFTHSLIVYLCWFIPLIIISFIVFKKKNIKNS